MKYFVFGDVHGDYSSLMKAIKNSGYDCNNKNHQIISLGDNFGRAERDLGSAGIWHYLTSEEHINKPICIRGNHETILLRILQRGFFYRTDILNGEHLTIKSFANCSLEDAVYNPEAINKVRKLNLEYWIKQMPWYYETEHFIFVHGWVAKENECWEDATWSHSLNKYKNLVMQFEPMNKMMIAGHWTTSDFWNLIGIRSNDIFYDKEYNVCFLDTCTVLTHKVNILVVED